MADDRVIQQVKEANDIVDLVGAYVSLRPAGATFRGLCPFHDDHRPSFDVDPRRQRYRCWSCGKHGDVLSFLMEHERLSFPEALEILAKRAGISLEKTGGGRPASERAAMLEVMKWSAEQFQNCLAQSPAAQAARCYLDERRLTADSLAHFGIGFAPAEGSWLVGRAGAAGKPLDMLEKLGLIAQRSDGDGFYDRFRDRVMFPIRDARGQTLGFGGRILPSSPHADKAPKYYNSAETPLFVKSEHLFGLDRAVSAGRALGYLAVVEGYTDVVMAHQLGVTQVVATLGTALNARHVQQLRRFVPRVVLVFDADAGGKSGVDRALEIFVSQNVELAIAALPAGLDPFDLLVQQGAEPFRKALAEAVDALEFKLKQVLASGRLDTVEGKRQAVEEILKVIALAPEMPGQEGAVRRELMMTRIAKQFGLQEKTLWARLHELRDGRAAAVSRAVPAQAEREAPAAAPAADHEKQLVQVLLAEPNLVPVAAAAVSPDDLEHPGLRRLIEEMYRLHLETGRVDLDLIRARLDNSRLAEKVLEFHDIGRENPDRPAWLQQVLDVFHQRKAEPIKQELKSRLQAARDHTEAVDLLRQLQKQQACR